ncbi:GNAT family N-acetyltransferase [Halobacillus locisalis]|uniref:GNAT family N-acetyltransferase n=1 Tax=Halobacillus locisalis TaxID=220753 RepID=A0A838CTC6_9BACI|nr:GNAT family N-acetyltransferase [Halobacillus locisalis]MBA2175194.1 GNAT family N-acetyltransferase [Halobacillus locisalis]
MHIRELEVKELHNVAEWLYHMNEQDSHYVAWLASDPNEIFEQIWTLTQFRDPLAYVAWEGENIIGFLGLLPFFDQKLCRLLGPFALENEREVIEQLWDKASITIHMHFDMAKVACFDSNEELISFTERHDFQLYNVEKTLALHRHTFDPTTSDHSSIVNVLEDDHDQVDQLHPTAAYYTTEEMLRLSKEPENYLWGFQKDGNITGYLYFETIIEGHEGEICFVNVDHYDQGEGIGSTLIEYALHYAFHALDLDVVTISVRNQNAQAEKLYRQIGFREINTIYAYEKSMTTIPTISTTIH